VNRTTTGETSETADARRSFEETGFCLASSLLDAAQLPGAVAAMDRVIAGDYATGNKPLARNVEPTTDPLHLVKIDQPQISDPSISELFRTSGIGAFAAGLLNAQMIQVWAVQLLHKPPAVEISNVGWHQDDDYWNEWWDGEVFTCWLALSDVGPDAGPLRFVPGSHRWGFLAAGNFFVQDLDSLTGFALPEGATWAEEPVIIPAGSASFHHRRTIHGSGPNTSGGPRRSYAIHMRTERSTRLGNAPPEFTDYLSDPAIAPVIFGG
jgi:ectoine hydroxylase-related dioxygenase (phytanoyl-CoA dioxygenase family)